MTHEQLVEKCIREGINHLLSLQEGSPTYSELMKARNDVNHIDHEDCTTLFAIVDFMVGNTIRSAGVQILEELQTDLDKMVDPVMKLTLGGAIDTIRSMTKTD